MRLKNNVGALGVTVLSGLLMAAAMPAHAQVAGIKGSDTGGNYILYYINTNSTNTSNSPTALATGLGDSTPQSFTFQAFNAGLNSLGNVSLTSIVIGLKTNAGIDASVFNNNNTSDTIDQLQSSGSLSISSQGLGVNTTVAFGPSQLQYTYSGSPIVVAGKGTIYEPSQLVDAGNGTFSGGYALSNVVTSQTISDSTTLAQYVGTSSQTISFSEGAPGVSASGHAAVTGGVYYGGDIVTSTTPTIKYYYVTSSGAPEPGAVSLAIPGLLGLAGLGWRKRRAA